ncbi:MAG: tetratricopeptide repeat protein [Desulfobacterales bacterium]|nr:MAG: tetratricopeptide repeat protein [Desulfobacterales bacterium]
MNRTLLPTIICLVIFLTLRVANAHAESAMEYFNLGEKSTITRTKIKYFSRALELDPYMAEAYEKRGLLYFFQEKFNQAIQDFDAFIRLVPANAKAYRMLAMAYLKSDFYEQAIAKFTRAIELEPELAAAYAYRAEAYRYEKKYEDAIRDATTSINMTFDGRIKSDAYRTRAKALREIGQEASAIVDVKAAWDIDPRVPQWWRYFLKSASPEELRFFSPFLIVGIALVVIFGIKFKPPDKDD